MKHGDLKIKAVSTTNFFPDSLAVMGEAVGFPKHSVDVFTSDEDLLSIYCFRDVEILVETTKSYVSFLQEHDLGRFALTRASQSMYAFRHRFMRHQMYIHTESEVWELEKRAYHGGRTEAFHIGKLTHGPFTSLDVNSMYPAVMKSFPYPTRLLAHQQSLSLKRCEEFLPRFSLIAHAYLDTDSPIYAYRKDGKIIFPVGRFDTYLCTEGLRTAMQRGHLVKLGETAIYDNAPIFEDFIDYFYSLRLLFKQQGNKLYDKFAKYLMNSLYGKFGQQVSIESSREDLTFSGYYRKAVYSLPDHCWIYETKLLNVATIEQGREPSKTTIGAIAAHVTENARLLLWTIIEQIGTQRVLYCDTDSVKVRVRDVPRARQFMDDKALGFLKREEDFQVFVIHGLKDYRQDEKVVLKGVPKHAVRLREGVYRYDAFQRQATHLRMQIDDRYVLRKIEKVLVRNYTKGTVTKTGRVLPLSLHLF
jgi:hypothetical protein